MTQHQDQRFMRQALALAGRGLGSVAPNPAVGCVIVSEARGEAVVAGRGWTQPGGRPHAETEALRRAGADAKGATAYVSLEPCAHHGETPPCADALIEAGIKRAVIAVRDPDPRVSGEGIARLERAGIAVEEGVLETEAAALNAGFFHRVTEGRPLVTLKVAASLDGKTATAKGHSQWITGETARSSGHLLRATHDAILIGSTTALVDDPSLTCRLPGLEGRSPLRIVADGRLRLPLTAKLVATAAETPTLVLARADADPFRREALVGAGVDVADVEVTGEGLLDMRDALATLAGRGITRLLVEGGAHVAASLLRAGLVDAIHWFAAPLVVGGDGHGAVAAFGTETLDEARRFALTEHRSVGEDVCLVYERMREAPCSPAS